MTSGARLLAVWLTPVVWFSMPTLIVDRGPDGLWTSLVFTIAPLLALRVGRVDGSPQVREASEEIEHLKERVRADIRKIRVR